ncbi:MAG: hypothetical protein IJ154_00650 [Bacteroidales bacterium]|nr:hypothetical protein [Bacteroidales bacterium]
MKYTTGNIFVCLLVLLACLSAGCREDRERRSGEDMLRLQPYAGSFCELSGLATKATVTPPAGYVLYSALHPSPELNYATIGVFLTRAGESVAAASGSFTYQGADLWTSNVKVKSLLQYYLYGFMPAEIASSADVAPYSGSFANGAVMTIEGLDAVTPADLCVVSGVKGVESADESPVALRLGQFGYLGKEIGYNYVYLLLEHLYAGLDFNIRIDAGYKALRTVKLKEMRLRTAGGSSVDATVTIAANGTGASPLTSVSFDVTAGSDSTTMFLNEDGLELTEDYHSVLGCFTPGLGNDFTLISIYDVYDTKGNLVRKDCRAENDLSRLTLLSSLTRGQKYTINLTVNPTYLYQLSEPDLDNPVIDLN